MHTNSKIYIAGHTGLVGSALHRNLIKAGFSNFVFTSYPEYDLINQQTVEHFFEKEKPEYVFLAAAKVGGIVANNTYRAQFIYENLQIQNNIIHFAWKYGVKKLLFLGSSCIYPKSCPQPIQEDFLLTDTLEYTNEPYAIAKIAGLKMCESYNLQYGTNFIAVMPTNLYGFNDNFDLEKSHVLPALIRKMHLGKCLEFNKEELLRLDLNKKPIEGISGKNTLSEILTVLEKYGVKKVNTQVSVEIWGTGTPKREFLHADDLAEACIYLMKNITFKDLVKINNIDNEVRNTHINIGSGVDFTIKEIAELLKQIVGYSGLLKYNTEKPDGTPQKLLNVNKINQLGWNNRIDFKEGLQHVYEHYVNN